VSETRIARGSATLITQEIRQRVREQVGITLSAGIAPNKFLAKIASDWNKPDGQFTITPDEVDGFVATLAVQKLFGVGSVTAKRMHDMGLHTCGDLQRETLTDLTRHFGKFGARLYELCRGQDTRAVTTQRVRKSLSAERTYASDLPSKQACLVALQPLVEELHERIERADCAALITQRTMKVRFAGFETTTVASSGTATGFEDFEPLLHRAWQRGEKPVRLLGVGVKLARPDAGDQLGLF
jgi:DNA polymerase-4